MEVPYVSTRRYCHKFAGSQMSFIRSSENRQVISKQVSLSTLSEKPVIFCWMIIISWYLFKGNVLECKWNRFLTNRSGQSDAWDINMELFVIFCKVRQKIWILMPQQDGLEKKSEAISRNYQETRGIQFPISPIKKSHLFQANRLTLKWVGWPWKMQGRGVEEGAINLWEWSLWDRLVSSLDSYGFLWHIRYG